MAKGDDARLVGFAVAVLDLCDKLPKSPAGTHIAGQLLRSGNAGAPNYAESRAAESASDFIHRLGIVLKELNETRVWLEMIQKKGLISEELIRAVLDECTALSKIIAVSRRTAAENAGKMRQKGSAYLSMIHGSWITDNSKARQRRAFARGEWGSQRTSILLRFTLKR
jgi:four helix bundle protein